MNLLLPSGIAGIIFIITGAIESGDHSDTDLLGGLAMFPYILVVSYLYAIIPSAICTSLMEYLYRRRSLSPNSRKALYVSALCGTLASLIMASPFFIASLTGGLGSKPENQGTINELSPMLGPDFTAAFKTLLMLATSRKSKVDC
jgi:hypothetical protein